MKRPIILFILILVVGFFVWRVFVKSFSQEPIEIIPKNQDENNAQILDDTMERSIDASIPNEKTDETTLEDNKGNLPSTSNNSSEEEKEKSTPSISFIINKKVSWGFTVANNREIDTIVIHSSYDALGDEPYDLDGLINEYKQYEVAPHFLINRKGKVYQLVSEKNIAYHAGVSKMPDGRTGVNNFSIGIELMNTEKDDYTDNQYSGLNDLIDYLESQYEIKYVLGHEDISPSRKTDPWNFDWKKMKSANTLH